MGAPLVPRQSTPRNARARAGVPLLVMLAAAAVLVGQVPAMNARRMRGCPAGCVLIDEQYCIDRFEGSLVEVLPRGVVRTWSPFEVPTRERRYRAVSRGGVIPQGYISQVQAAAACRAAG